MSFIDLPVLQAPPVLKPPSSLVVRYGHMRMMGEFPYDGDTRPGCGAKVAIRTNAALSWPKSSPPPAPTAAAQISHP